MVHLLFRRSVKYLSWGVLFGVMLACMMLLTLRYWFLPDIGKYRSEIAAAISKAAGQTIDFDGIYANWNGLRPYLSLHGVRVSDLAGNTAIDFPKIQGTVSWRSVVYGELNFHEIVIDQPALIVQRDNNGYLRIADTVLDPTQHRGGFLDWLLRQRRLTVRQATLYWQDDLRGAPVLSLESVNLHLQNEQEGRRHRFGIRIESPAALAARVEIRGDFIGESIYTPATWQGRFFVQLQDIDFDGWQKWVTLPNALTVSRGKGSLRGWGDIDAGQLVGWIADISLLDTRLRAAQHLPALEIDKLNGRLGKRKIDEASRLEEVWFARNLSVDLKGRPLTRPATIEWRTLSQKGHTMDNSLQVEALDIGVFAKLAASLPIDDSLHQLLVKLSPEGVVEQAQMTWQGVWPVNANYRIRGDFNNVAVQSCGKHPSISGVSGSIDTTGGDGMVNLFSENLAIGRAKQTGQEIEFSLLTGQFNWKTLPDRQAVFLEFNDIAFSNKAGTGSIQGHYVFDGNLRGEINLKGNLVQADLAQIRQYLGWLTDKTRLGVFWESTFKGRLENAKFEVQGVLDGNMLNSKDRFAIHVETEIKDTIVIFSNDWPSVSGIAGRLSLQDDALEIILSTANLGGISLQDVTLRAKNLYSDKAIVQVKGLAEGDASRMAALIHKSPWGSRAGELLKNTTISGKGRLQIDLTAPLKQEDLTAVKLAGRFQFINNQIDFGRYVPELDEVSGAIVFTESSVRFEELRAQMLGGAVEVYAIPLPGGGLRIAGNGHANFDRLQPDAATKPTSLLQLWARFFKGGTDWQAMMDIEREGVSIVIESVLEGMMSTLPAPFSKTAQEIIPVRYEKHFVKPQDDLVRFSYGQIVSAELERIREKPYHYHPVRGAISFGGVKIRSGIPGTSIYGEVSRLEWDQWRELIKLHGEIDALSGHIGRGLDGFLTESAQFDLRIGELEFLGNYFNDGELTIDRKGKFWKIHATSKEIVGMIDWYETMPQKVMARLSKLVMPKPSRESDFIASRQNLPKDWPAVDIEAEELVINEKLFGKLKLEALQREDGWHIENLVIERADNKLETKGIWQNRVFPFKVRHDFLLRSGNVGKFLKHHGYPDQIARGEGELTGSLEWAGKPFSIDFPSLAGKLDFMIKRGQFVKIRLGIGKLLGVFDLKSLPRRLTFDFYDILGKGFGFDYFHGNVSILDGIATSDELHITGSAADLAVSGELDLVKKTQSLNLKVFPSLGLATPVASIAAMIATQSLQDPFDRVLLSEYAITGSWSEPVVIRLDNNKSRLDSPANKTGSVFYEAQRTH